jgi:hypothetical protein
LWTKVPRVLYNQPTEILLYFDNTQEDNTYYIGVTGEKAAQKVWDAGFAAVYHMVQNPSVGGACILDSTINKNNGTPSGMIASDLISTTIGKGLIIAGTDYISVAHTNNITFTKSYTTEVVMTPRTDSYDNSIIVKGNVNGQIGYGLSIDSNRCFNAFSDSNGSWGPTQNAIDPIVKVVGEEVYLTGTFNGTTTKLYKNANFTNSQTTADMTLYSSTTPLVIGKHVTWGSIADFIIREIRLSNSVRSNTWIKATNYSCKDQLVTISSAPIYQISGYITSNNQPAQRQVFLYERTSGELVDKGTSTTGGYYSLKTPFSGEHNIVCLDDPYDVDLDDLILSKVIPTEVV